MKRLILIGLLVLGGLGIYFSSNNEMFDDYYEYVNKDFLNENYLSDDTYIYNTFTIAQEESDKVMDGIIEDVVEGDINIGKEQDDVSLLYGNVVDIDEINKVGLGILKRYIDKMMESRNIDELIDNVFIIEKELSIDIFTRIAVDKDFKDNSKNIVYLYPVTFAFSSTADYYVDDDYMSYKAYIKRAIVELLEVYGYNRNEARMISREVISFYEEIGRDSKLSDAYEDVTKYYNIVDNNYLDNLYTKFDVSNYLKNKGIVVDKYSLVDEEQYKKINELLTADYLMVWKKSILVKILSSYAEFMGSNYYDIVVKLNNSLTGSVDEVDYREDAIGLIGNVFEEKLDKLYDDKVMMDEDKEYFESVFLDIKKYFEKMLKKNSWLSDKTIKEALVKLDKMRVYVGFNDSGNEDEEIELKGDNLLSNIIELNEICRNSELERLGNNDSAKALGMSDVNAYYNPMTNAVYIPSSVVFLYDKNDSNYQKLGTIGYVIAHEITHGFDYNGSLFDSNGNMFNWWSEIDRENYSKLKSEVVDYYNGFEVIDGKHIDGEKTVNENIADMGAIKIISGVAKDSGATKKEMQEMYRTFAEFWKCQVNESYVKLLLLNDSHSPNKYRVNAVLSVTDDFYDTYRLLPWNDMYISKKNRVSVW